VRSAHHEFGWIGMLLILLRAYSMGAGTYTGIEAVSNGLNALREPRVETGKRTMVYMAVSLSFVVGGLLLAYLLYHVEHVDGKTLNAVLFERMTAAWPATPAKIFVVAALASSAALLFIAAQTGFFGGPRILANMAVDRWMPTRFATLSDRLVTQNGVFLMGGATLFLVAALLDSVQTFPLTYQSPMARLSIRITPKLRWNAGWQFYGYGELFHQLGYDQNFHAHTGYTSVLWSF